MEAVNIDEGKIAYKNAFSITECTSVAAFITMFLVKVCVNLMNVLALTLGVIGWVYGPHSYRYSLQNFTEVK